MSDLLEQLREENPDALLADGFEQAFVGICRRFGQPPIALYDRRKCLEILVAEGSSEEEAEEFFDYNTLGAWVGEHTPAYADLTRGDVGLALAEEPSAQLGSKPRDLIWLVGLAEVPVAVRPDGVDGF